MLRVLLVDDDRDVLDGIGDWLRQSFDVTTALGFPAAIQCLADGPLPDVVITDLEMPPYSGEDLLVVLAARFPTVCRILHTGSVTARRSTTVAHHIFGKGRDLRELDALLRRCSPALKVG
jgi:CheY-like chemotaxis protein